MLSYTLLDTSLPKIIQSKDYDLYQYCVYIGKQSIPTKKYNSYWYLENNQVVSTTGTENNISSQILCVEIFGYTPETRTSTYSRYTDLPYINGCSTKQLINPARLGDPTWQMLMIPPWTSEQAHHIHSTTRVVYVAKGNGLSHIGNENNLTSIPLEEGSVLILDKMIPHHFSTEDESLIVLPLHIFSSTDQEYNHPMFNGTYKI